MRGCLPVVLIVAVALVVSWSLVPSMDRLDAINSIVAVVMVAMVAIVAMVISVVWFAERRDDRLYRSHAAGQEKSGGGAPILIFMSGGERGRLPDRGHDGGGWSWGDDDGRPVRMIGRYDD